MIEVSVDLLVLKPACSVQEFFNSMRYFSVEVIISSKILASVDVKKVGQYDLILSFGFSSFRISTTVAINHSL